METDTPSPRPSFGRRVLGWLAEGAIIVVGAIIIATVLRTFVGQMFLIPSGSMENTLQIDDRVLVVKFGGFERGDVVVFEDPAHWLTPQPREDNLARDVLEFVGVLPNSGTEHLIKRVIGMPGDRVRLDANGRIEVNGQELDESDYLYTRSGIRVAPATVPFDVVVPEDRLFVMGDHRNASRDSRCMLSDIRAGLPEGMAAFVPIDDVVGKSVAVLAPFERFTTFSTPETFAQVPDPDKPAPPRPELIHVEAGC